MTMLTYQFRIKDSTTKKTLIKLASNVNFIWNVSLSIVKKRWNESRLYTDEKLLNTVTKGSSKEDEIFINAQTVQATYQEIIKKTKQFKKSPRFRSRKIRLGWIPFKGQTFKIIGNYVIYNGYRLKLWKHREFPKGSVVNSGSFSEDSQGRWYVNIVISFPEYLEKADGSVGIDLGIKTTLSLSTEEKFNHDNFSKSLEVKLAKAQRHKKKRQIKKIHAKIKNKRKDWNHKTSNILTKNYRNIFVGDTTPTAILSDLSTKINRSIYDASWYQIKTCLAYKVLRRQGCYLEVSEKDSTLTCSNCLRKLESLDLKIREWTCPHCKSRHDRDVNAAKNHLRLGSETLSKLKAA